MAPKTAHFGRADPPHRPLQDAAEALGGAVGAELDGHLDGAQLGLLLRAPVDDTAHVGVREDRQQLLLVRVERHDLPAEAGGARRRVRDDARERGAAVLAELGARRPAGRAALERHDARFSG